LLIDLHLATQTIEDRDQRAIVVPLIKQTPNRLPWTKRSWQVTPGRTGAQRPQNSVHHRSPIAWRTSCAFGRSKQIVDQIPLLIRETMSKHDDSFHQQELSFISA
jgi:hypothetical protein